MVGNGYEIFQEPKIHFLIIASLALNIFIWFYIIFNFLGVKSFVPLHYNIFPALTQLVFSPDYLFLFYSGF